MEIAEFTNLETSKAVNNEKTLGLVTGLQVALNNNNIDRAYRMPGNNVVGAGHDKVKVGQTACGTGW